MNPTVNKEYLKAVELGLKGEKHTYLNEVIIEEKRSLNIAMTIKNYRIRGGLSHSIHHFAEKD
jgi:hypothetical protein